MTLLSHPFLTTLQRAALGLLLSSAALAQTPASGIQIDGAWARASVQGQMASGAFMRITAKTATQLVGVASPAAGVAEVHEMKMEGDVMKMRALPALDLPAGKPVTLSPGGYHVMLMDLKAPLKPGTSVPLTLSFKDAKGVLSQMAITLPVSASAPASASASAGTAAPAHKH